MPVVDMYGSAYAYAFEETALDQSNADHLTVLQDLLPYGPAWTRDPEAYLTKLLRGLAREASRIELTAAGIIEETDPRTTQLLLAEWEAFAGMPACGGTPNTIEGRQAALVGKLTQFQSPKPSTFQAFAESLGYTDVIVTRSDGRPYFGPGSHVGDTVGGGPWRHAFSVHTAESQTAEINAELQCRIDALTPGHAVNNLYLDQWPTLADDNLFRPNLETLLDPVSEVQGTGSNDYEVDTLLLDGSEWAAWSGVPSLAGSAATFAAWVRADAIAASDVIFAVDSTTTTDAYLLRFTAANGSIGFIHLYDGGGTHRQRVATDRLVPGRWYHVALTLDATALASGVTIYIDGVAQASYATSIDGSGGTPRTADGDWVLGSTSTQANGFSGAMRDPRIWDRVLTSDEVADLYNFGRIKRWNE